MDVDADNYLVLTSQLAVQRRQAGREGGVLRPLSSTDLSGPATLEIKLLGLQ